MTNQKVIVKHGRGQMTAKQVFELAKGIERLEFADDAVIEIYMAGGRRLTAKVWENGSHAANLACDPFGMVEITPSSRDA